MAIVPSTVGMALLAQPIVDSLLGAQWTSTAPVLAALSLAGLFQALNVLNLAFLTGLGEYRTQRIIGALMATGTGLGVIAGAPWGAAGVGWGVSVSSMLTFGISCALVGRRIGLGTSMPLTGLVRAALPTGGMAIAVLYTVERLSWVETPIYMLPLPIAVGAVTYALLYVCLWRSSLVEDAKELRRLLR
jgi:O-antigen/teichoic acid export membrane protein